MFGIESNFCCPNCEYKGVVDLGITSFVNIKNKGKNLAVRSCPKCRHTIAFPLDEDTPRSFSSYNCANGNYKVINCILDTVNSFSEQHLKNEETIKQTVLQAVAELVGQTYVDKYYVEIIQTMELQLCKRTRPYTKGIDLDLIPDEDIETCGVVCY